ncbi:hypothetical protein PUN28_011728 [Cardiocondyla obscurior]|uniref:Uncharacterized protein n=1 Tax=Cardiocondyla obscurior TaxID=286306 RepID=A0AAW2FHP3_9HYME
MNERYKYNRICNAFDVDVIVMSFCRRTNSRPINSNFPRSEKPQLTVSRNIRQLIPRIFRPPLPPLKFCAIKLMHARLSNFARLFADRKMNDEMEIREVPAWISGHSRTNENLYPRFFHSSYLSLRVNIGQSLFSVTYIISQRLLVS